jgi:uncharacterized protein DUF5615
VKILPDECIDRRLARDFTGHEVQTVPQMGWAGIENGELLTLAQGIFDIFVTVDRNLSFQQNLSRYDIAVIVLRCRSNRLGDLRQLVPDLIHSLSLAKAREVLWIEKPVG